MCIILLKVSVEMLMFGDFLRVLVFTSLMKIDSLRKGIDAQKCEK